MREFVEQDDTIGKGKKFGQFRDVLNDINSHPNQKYWILKSIILNNLYGVDIMHEAVEIAKLRLFLKLAATADVDYNKENLGLEPLPDIDFNIRSGNTLVGFASEADLKRTIAEKDALFAGQVFSKIQENTEKVNMAYGNFKNYQLIEDKGNINFKKAKDELSKRLDALNESLNQYQAYLYGVNADKKPEVYKKWKSSHRPFHWYAEFYEIIHGNGGFDVIIGNPPYVEYSKVKKHYTIKRYKTEKCGNLYAFVMERAVKLASLRGFFGIIIPVSLGTSSRMEP
ncbi:MAG: Eco57I restriction-modification methylase domain-containing protein, partial [Deltaproteobacteria bacterium]|nr:Eco57I restriction-modification methylase domain-containing protein [Deltaproteobacteria bacterium]